MNFSHPFRIDGRGRTATAGADDHIRDLIEQVLFTSPGERVNRPSFGSDLRRVLFSQNNDALTTAAQVLVQSALQQWLGDLIQVEAALVEVVESVVTVTVRYVVRRSQARVTAQFSGGG